MYSEFTSGNFSIKRISKPFSKTAIDLTLEQTINADTASQRTGITAMTNSISARQRWAKMHHISTTMISNVFNELGLTRSDDVSKELKPNKIRKNCNDINALTNSIIDTMDPFSNEINKEVLFNIATGKAAPKEIEDFLLNIETIGSIARDKFVNECKEDPKRFEQGIPRQKLRTFAANGKRFKLNTESKTVAIRMERDLFGSILFLALKKKVDMSSVLKYPLTPAPLSLCHVDGTMNQTPKLMSELASKIPEDSPSYIDITRSSRWRCSYERGVLKIYSKLLKKHLRWRAIFVK